MVNFTAILNQAIKHKKTICYVPLTRINIELLRILNSHGFIYSYNINNESLKISVILNLIGDQFSMKEIKLVSKPSRKVYLSLKKLKKLMVKEGRFYIISTSSGIISSESAFKLNISGEVWIEILR